MNLQREYRKYLGGGKGRPLRRQRDALVATRFATYVFRREWPMPEKKNQSSTDAD